MVVLFLDLFKRKSGDPYFSFTANAHTEVYKERDKPELLRIIYNTRASAVKQQSTCWLFFLGCAFLRFCLVVLNRLFCRLCHFH